MTAEAPTPERMAQIRDDISLAYTATHTLTQNNPAEDDDALAEVAGHALVFDYTSAEKTHVGVWSGDDLVVTMSFTEWLALLNEPMHFE